MKAIRLSLVIVLMASSRSALCQGNYGGYPQPYGDNRATTPGQARAYGMSSVIRSKGQYNQQTSEAAINMTEAASRQMDNQIQRTDTYFQKQQMNKSYRAAAQRPRATKEQLTRLAQVGLPARLSPSELDSVTGKITWPVFLTQDLFAADRKELEEAFAERAKAGTATWDNLVRIEKGTRAMQAQLKTQAKKVSSASLYVQAKSFINSLAYEAKTQAT